MQEQYAYQSFSNEEVENLKNGLIQVEFDLSENSNNWEEFIDSPFNYLEQYNIGILKRFKAFPKLINNFNDAIRNIFTKFRRIFNKCLACKVAIIALFYSLLGHIGHMIDLTVDFLTVILDGAKKYFEGTSKDSDNLLNHLSSLLSKLSIPELALTICKHYRHCD